MKWFKLTVAIIFILIINIVLCGIGNKYKNFYKNEIQMEDLNGNIVKYSIEDKNILVFSADCEDCRKKLMLLGEQSESTQKKIELISISGIEETRLMLQKYKVISNVYIDYRKDFSLKFNISSVPVIYSTVDNSTIRNDDFLNQVINNSSK